MNNIGIFLASSLKNKALSFVREMRNQGISESEILVIVKYFPFFLNGVNEAMFGVNLNITKDEFEDKV